MDFNAQKGFITIEGSFQPCHLIFLPLHAVWGLDLCLLLPNVRPVGAQHGAAALLEALVHRPLGVVARISVYFLKHLIEGRLPLLLLLGLGSKSLLDSRPVPSACVGAL